MGKGANVMLNVCHYALKQLVLPMCKSNHKLQGLPMYHSPLVRRSLTDTIPLTLVL